MRYIAKISLVILLGSLSLFAQAQTSKISSMPGAFSRLGFGARGIGMGNAMSAVNEGNLVSYYNPAVIPYQDGNSFQTAYTFLSLDRSLNFLSFTRRFEFGEKEDGTPRSVAGLSAGIINSGVSNIDQRDNQGFKTGDLSTSENQFFIGLSNRFSEKFSVGLAIKFYYYSLYEDISSTGIGFDIGALYSILDNLKIAFVISDINSKYKWDTTDLYGQEGTNTEDKFPVLRKFGLSYKLESIGLLLSGEFENSNAETNILRLGAEYNIFDMLFLRGGIDRLNLSNSDFPVRPSLGFSYFYNLNDFYLGFDYAFVIEPYSSSDIHMVGLNFRF